MPLTTYTAGEVLTAASLNDNFSFAASSGKIAQVVSTNLPTTFTSSAVAYTDITGLSVSITPTLATSKVLVLVSLSARVNADANLFFRQMRDAVAINIGDAAGTRTQTSVFQYVANSSYNPGSCSWNFLDSPATTSATTYKTQFRNASGVGTLYMNRRGNDQNTDCVSNITVMEIPV